MLSAQPSRVILLDTGEGGSLGELGRPDPGCSPGRGRAREGGGLSTAKTGFGPLCAEPQRVPVVGVRGAVRAPIIGLPVRKSPLHLCPAGRPWDTWRLISGPQRHARGLGTVTAPAPWSRRARGVRFDQSIRGNRAGVVPPPGTFWCRSLAIAQTCVRTAAGHREGEHGGGSACTGERHFGWRDPKEN